MSTLHRVLAYLLFVIAFALFIVAFFKGTHVFIGAGMYALMGVCLMDSANEEKELEK